MSTRTGFFDPASGGPVEVRLAQLDAKDFRMLRRLGYRDPNYVEAFVVPANEGTFRTDLTSVPALFLWLVPSVGTHLPAALLHDGLVYGPDEEKSYEGPDIAREEADRIFRDAMQELGVPRLRRWLIWTAVTLATVWSTGRWRWRGTVLLTFLTVIVLGVIATLDLLDVWNVLPWMGDRPTWFELVSGAVVAVIVPCLLSLLWGHLWKAGLIAGLALAFLIHVTIAVGIVTLLYIAAEWVISSSEKKGPSIRSNLDLPPKP